MLVAPQTPGAVGDVSLVGGLEHGFYFPFHIWDVILPIDELHHFSRWLKPPTSDEFGGFLLQNDTKKIESNSL